jgi:FAD/FMN-containing dehydrogenase
MQRNFGGNQLWDSHCYQPAGEADVLAILEKHRGQRIRALGSGHSWSAIGVCSEITLDLSAFDQVDLVPQKGEPVARIGAGCRLQKVLDDLHGTSARTLPTLGVIKRQTVAGAISTGTHGSGRQSLSHFVVAVRLAAYDASGAARIFEYRDGDALRAARCALGCAGILLSVEMATVPKYRIAESVRRETSLDAVLACYQEHPLTQFALAPYAWEYVVFERTPVVMRAEPLGGRLKAWALRIVNTLWVDVGFHLLVKASLVFGERAMKALQRKLPQLALKASRLDDAEHVLTMGHHYFRHEEMELFVPESALADTLAVLRYATEVFAGEEAAPLPGVAAALEEHGLHASLLRSRGLHTQHYPFSIRRLLPEDALISMGSSAAEPWFSISVFTYQGPTRRSGYYAFCAWLAHALHTLCGARLHWGKHFPLDARASERMYPRLEDFRAFCRAHDPSGVFVNRYAEEVLGLGAGPRA